MRVIMPSALMNEAREHLRDPFAFHAESLPPSPLEMACSSPLLRVSWRMHLRMSNCVARLLLLNTRLPVA